MPYLLRRALHTLVLLFAVSILTFALINLGPGDFFDELRMSPQVSPTTIQGLRKQHGLDRSLPVKYLQWLESGAKGDWGTSLAYNSPAAAIVGVRARNTLLLTGTATLVAWLMALPLGIWAAASHGKLASLITQGSVALLLAVPEIVLALLLLLFAVRSNLFPAGGMSSPRTGASTGWSESKDLLHHLVLPAFALSLSLLPLFLVHVRAAVMEVVEAPFIVSARAHGISPLRLLIRHALPVAANPLISLLGISIGMLLSSSIVVEGIFSWPGLGTLLIQAILQRDLDVIVDAVLLAAALLALGNLVADGLLHATDPRIRSPRWLSSRDPV